MNDEIRKKRSGCSATLSAVALVVAACFVIGGLGGVAAFAALVAVGLMIGSAPR